MPLNSTDISLPFTCPRTEPCLTVGHSDPRIWASDVQLPAMLRAGSVQWAQGAGRTGKAGGSTGHLKALTFANE